MTKTQMTKTLTDSNIRKFEIRICFEFRASGFGFYYLEDLSDSLNYD